MILEVVFEHESSEISVELSTESAEITVEFSEDAPLDAEFGEVSEIISENVPRYDGLYEVHPSFSGQVLGTAGMLMEENVKVEQIPLLRISNNSGGTTVIIGG